MEHLLLQMIEEAKKDKKKLQIMKNMAVKAQQFELAANLRDMEKQFFPETEEEKEAKELVVLFQMIDITIEQGVAWMIAEALKIHEAKPGKFSIKDAFELKAKRDKIF